MKVFCSKGCNVGTLVRNHIHRLFAKCLAAEQVELPGHFLKSKVARVFDLTFGRRTGHSVGLVIAAAPSELRLITQVGGWRSRFSSLIGYVIDSWYPEWFSPECRLYDAIFVSRLADVDPVRQRVRPPVHYLPLGVDVMMAGHHLNLPAPPHRPIDLLAYGRQPFTPEELLTAASAAGLNFKNGIPSDEDPDRNQSNIFAGAAIAKFTLAFCNTVRYHDSAPKVTTPFLTFRWLDNLAAGATMVGMAPQTPGVEHLIGWEGACHSIPNDLTTAMERVAQLVAQYSPQTGLENHYQSLIRNDWRLRLQSLMATLNLKMPQTLQIELDKHEEYTARLKQMRGRRD